jgi:hypothetical protein
MSNKEILEEAAKKELRKLILAQNGIVPGFIDGFEAGAKWKAERMYSEACTRTEEWFEQFKKQNNEQ